MKRLILILPVVIISADIFAQVPGKTDSSQVLEEVVIKAFEQNRQLKEVSAAINFIGKTQLERFNNTNILPALNSTPGVRMEERSPGSYRLNVRGSTLRSPFGVRNVKVYWNGIPFTDPGGNTYLNQFSFYNINSIEIIKGPASSLYGAGTGGAVLLNSQLQTWQPAINLSYLHGSFNLNVLNAQVKFGKEEHQNTLGFTHQTSDGYRNHSNMRRDIATWETVLKAGDRQQLSASVLYGDLYYQTPGGLNKTDYMNNPKAARGPAGPNLGAEQAKAAIYQQTFLAGLTHDYNFSETFQNRSVVYGAFSFIKNPTFRNYEKRTEPHFGGRTVFSWKHKADRTDINLLFGMEAQHGIFNTKVFQNNFGIPDTLQTDDEIKNSIYSVFVQTDIRFPGNWTINAGVSINNSGVTITRLSEPSFTPVKRTYNSEWAPRVSLSKKIIPNLLVYASVARGFSPPTTQEILPSTSVISTGLEAEYGINYEAGIKSNWLQQRLYVEVNAFYYRLQNAIVVRKDSTNADYFINAGSTKQQGIESQVSYRLLSNTNRFITNAQIRASHTWNNFRYREFKQDANDFSGRKLPGVAPHFFSAAVDVLTKPGLYTNITWFYSDPVYLNDANTESATSYNLVAIRTGWKKPIGKKILADLFFGVDNLFDVRYSLGNDLNAFGSRYYNAAAGINYFAGINFHFTY